MSHNTTSMGRDKRSYRSYHDGWNDLYPGKSSLQDALQRLGQPQSQDELSNAKIYSFAGGSVSILIANDLPDTVFCIRVSDTYDGADKLPSTLAEAQDLFGPLVRTSVDQHVGLVFE